MILINIIGIPTSDVEFKIFLQSNTIVVCFPRDLCDMPSTDSHLRIQQSKLISSYIKLECFRFQITILVVVVCIVPTFNYIRIIIV